jgi:hypothetical protein
MGLIDSNGEGSREWQAQVTRLRGQGERQVQVKGQGQIRLKGQERKMGKGKIKSCRGEIIGGERFRLGLVRGLAGPWQKVAGLY